MSYTTVEAMLYVDRDEFPEEIKVVLTGTLVSGYPPTRDEPGEEAYFEDITATTAAGMELTLLDDEYWYAEQALWVAAESMREYAQVRRYEDQDA